MTRRNRDSVLRQFVSSPVGVIAAIILVVLVALAIPGSSGYGSGATTIDIDQANQGSTGSHWFGTDGLGRDIALRTLAATRSTLLLGFSAVILAVVLGSLVGALLAYSPRPVRRIGAVVLDVMMSLGDYLLAIVVVTILGVGGRSAVIAIGVAMAPGIARFVFSLVSSVMVRDYVSVAQVLGLPRRTILGRYVMTNTADSLIVTIAGRMGDGIVALSALSFLGLGVQAPSFDWGVLLTEGIKSFYVNPWAALVPASLILLTGLSLAMFGDALARAINPVLWVRDRPEAPGELGRNPEVP